MRKQKYVDVLDLCKYITATCTQSLKPINNLQLQKVLYNIQLNHIKEKQLPLFTDDIEAWAFGPVVVKAYRRYSIYGAMPIIETDTKHISKLKQIYKLTQGDIDLINKAINDVQKSNAWTIKDHSNSKNSPWDQVCNSQAKTNNNIITTQMLINYTYNQTNMNRR